MSFKSVAYWLFVPLPALLILILQARLLLKAFTLSDLPLQNAAFLLSLTSFLSLLFLSPTKNKAYAAPLIELHVMTALLNSLCIFYNRNDVVEPWASAIVLTCLAQTLFYLMLGAGEIAVTVRRTTRKSEEIQLPDFKPSTA